ncbi:MAG TPA: hypothetical protein VMT35_10885 [Ignavibacteriaceae bacterium]|nr:hypothetical protein [Ignavibacteriaceae bacterium]
MNITKLILSVFLLQKTVISQAVDLPLTISDNAGHSKELKYGTDPSATDGIDNSLGEATLPPLPPPPSFDARFNLPNTESTWKDYRAGGVNYCGVKIHEIQYQVGSVGTTITISWNMSEGITGRLQDIITGTFIDIQMSGIGSYTVNNPSAFNKLRMTVWYSNIKVFLEGCYSTAAGKMNIYLENLGYIPLHQPYIISPWNYNGSESVTSLPAGIVDWILLEIRSGIAASTMVTRKAAFLSSEGMIVDLDGSSSVQFNSLGNGNYYIIIRHRNHLPVMSSSTIYFSQGRAQPYNFTISQNKAYGNNPMTNLGNGKFGMICGDTNGDGIIDASDRSYSWNDRLKLGYKNCDITLDGIVDASDRSEIWNNRLLQTRVP